MGWGSQLCPIVTHGDAAPHTFYGAEAALWGSPEVTVEGGGGGERGTQKGNEA